MHPRTTASNLNQVCLTACYQPPKVVALTNLGTLFKLISTKTYFSSGTETFV